MRILTEEADLGEKYPDPVFVISTVAQLASDSEATTASNMDFVFIELFFVFYCGANYVAMRVTIWVLMRPT